MKELPKKQNNELQRLIGLLELDLNYPSLELELDGYAELAAQIAGADVALVNLIGIDTQWSVSRYGTDTRKMPKQDSICQHTVAESEPMELSDLKSDTRFCDKPYVLGGPEWNFYYGIPLATSSGTNIGALCVLHASNLDLSSEAKAMLGILAKKVVRSIEMSAKNTFLTEEVEVLEMAHRRLAHDVRGPLSGILGLADLMRKDAEKEVYSEVKESAEMVRESAMSLLELADNIMERKSSRATNSIGHKSYTCQSLGQSVKRLFSPQAKSKKIHFSVDFQEQEEPIYFQKRYLNQIVGNLVSNAIKFTPVEGKVTVQIKIGKEDVSGLDALLIEVTDTGSGISSDVVSEIEAGEMESQSGTTGEAGYGFGLPLVVGLLNKLDGKISFASGPGGGTVCDVIVPL